ncbi:hypothetical protein ACG7TL_007332 [Trametes sanguinea]
MFPPLSCPALTALKVVFRSEESFESFTAFLRDIPTLEDLNVVIHVQRSDDDPSTPRAQPSLPPSTFLPCLRRLRIAMAGFAADLAPVNLVPASQAAAANSTSSATIRTPRGSRVSTPWLIGDLVLDVNTDRINYHVSGRSVSPSKAGLQVFAVLRFPWECLRWWKGSWRQGGSTTPARPWFAADVKALRFTVGSKSMHDYDCYRAYVQDDRCPGCLLSWLCDRCAFRPALDVDARLNSLPSLEKLVIRAKACGEILPQLCTFLAQASPGGCPVLRTLVLSLLRVPYALEDMRPLFDALERRVAAGGNPLENLVLCTPLHAGPDYSVYNRLHGVRWVTFSSIDPSSSGISREWANSDLTGRSDMSYDEAWAAFASHSARQAWDQYMRRKFYFIRPHCCDPYVDTYSVT